MITSEQCSQSVLLLTPACQWGGWGCIRGWWVRTADPTDQSDILHHVVSCSAYTAGEGRKKRGDAWNDDICWPCSQVIIVHDRALLSWIWLRTHACPRDMVNSLFCFACIHSFSFTYQTLIIWIVLPILWRRWGASELLCGASLLSGVKPWQMRIRLNTVMFSLPLK